MPSTGHPLVSRCTRISDDPADLAEPRLMEATPREALRRARELRGWSQQHVADAIGAPTAASISRWERGAVAPSPYYQERLCRLFESDALQLGLLEGVPEATTPPAPRGIGGLRRRLRRRLLVLVVVAVAAAVLAVGAAVVALRSAAGPSTPAPTSTQPAQAVADRLRWPVLMPDLHRPSETVRALQLLLQSHSLDVGATGADAVFGGNTDIAVRTFQSTHGLAGTGTVDGPTWARLVTVVAPGDRGRQVEAAQRLLGGGVVADGAGGPATAAAVRAFRAAHGLPAGDTVDETVWCLLLGGSRVAG